MTEDLKSLAEIVTRDVLIPLDNYFVDLDKAIASASSLIQSPAKTFRAGLEGNWKIATLPYAMASDSIMQRHYGRIHSAESIRMLKRVSAGQDLTSELRAEAAIAAQSRFEEFVNTANGRQTIVGFILRELQHLLEGEILKGSAQELLMESLLMVWGTMEVFISDAIRSVLNANPNLACKLIAEDVTKKYLPSRGFTIDDLAKRNFNVAASLGDLLLEYNHLDSLPAIRDILRLMFPTATDLHSALGQAETWKLWQRRHLIAHRRGIADHSYVAKTGDNISAGTRIEVSGEYVENSFRLVRDIGIALIEAI